MAINIDTSKQNNRADNPRPKRLTGYRLCVYASGSLITDILSCFTLISVSCLHFGQNSGKCSSTVSSRNLIRVLFLQIGHNSHFIFKTLASFHYTVQPVIYPKLLFSRITFCAIYHERFQIEYGTPNRFKIRVVILTHKPIIAF